MTWWYKRISSRNTASFYLENANCIRWECATLLELDYIGDVKDKEKYEITSMKIGLKIKTKKTNSLKIEEMGIKM